MSRSAERDPWQPFRAQYEEAAASCGVWPAVPEPLSPFPPAEEAQLAERFGVDALRTAFERAKGAAAGRDGEPDRRAIRRLALPFLHRCARELTASLHRAAAGDDVPPAGFRATLRDTIDPEARERMLQLWLRKENSVASLREERRHVMTEAARRVGAGDSFELLAAAHPHPLGNTSVEFERQAIAPLDERMERAARERRARYRPALPAQHSAADDPCLAALTDHHLSFEGFQPGPLLRRIGSGLGIPIDAWGPSLGRSARHDARVAALTEAADGPVLMVPDRIGAADTLAELLDAFGRVLRAAFVRRAHGLDALIEADPAAGRAAGFLFRRLALSGQFRAHAGMESGQDFARDLAHEAALELRLEWARLAVACESGSGRPDYPAERFFRAAGRALPPDRTRGDWEFDPSGAAALRGALFAVALEERLLTRFGREWFVDRAAGRMLLEIWEADSRDVLEAVAHAYGLGTMDPAWLADRYRP